MTDLHRILDSAMAESQGLMFHNVRRQTIDVLIKALGDAGLTVVKGFDTSKAPHAAVRDCYPLVLYFATKEDADSFTAIVMEAKPGMVAHEVTS